LPAILGGMGDKIALYAAPGSRLLVVRSWGRAALLLAMGSPIVVLDGVRSGGLSGIGWVVGAVTALMAGAFALESLAIGPRLLPVMLVSERNGKLVFRRPVTRRRAGFGNFPVGVPLTLWHRRDVGYGGAMRWRLEKDRYRIVHAEGAIAWSAGTALAPDSLDRLERFLRERGTVITVSEEPTEGLLAAALTDSDGQQSGSLRGGEYAEVVLRPRLHLPAVVDIPTHSGDLTLVPLGSDIRATPDGRQRLAHDAVAEHMIAVKAPGAASMRVTIAFEAPSHKALGSSHTFGAWTDRLTLVDGQSEKSAQIILETFVVGVDVYCDPAVPSEVVLRLRAEN